MKEEIPQQKGMVFSNSILRLGISHFFLLWLCSFKEYFISNLLAKPVVVGVSVDALYLCDTANTKPIKSIPLHLISAIVWLILSY